jgi:hypothetical protein
LLIIGPAIGWLFGLDQRLPHRGDVMLEGAIDTVVAFFLGGLFPIFGAAMGYISGFGEGYILGYHGHDLNLETAKSLSRKARRRLGAQYPEFVRFRRYCQLVEVSMLIAIGVPAVGWLMHLSIRPYLLALAFWIGTFAGLYATRRSKISSFQRLVSRSLIELARRK